MLKDIITIAYNPDQISDSFEEGIQFIKKNKLAFVEIRNINGKNIVNLTLDETIEIKKTLLENGVSVSAIASPLFKWYPANSISKNDPDLFGVNPHLDRTEKKAMINKIIKQAIILGTKKIRIFSALKPDNAPKELPEEESELLKYALSLAKENGIALLLENEPVCFVSMQKDYIKMITSGEYIGLRAWFDIANVYENKEVISAEDLEKLMPFIDYIHFKDPVANTLHTYTTLGKGALDYQKVIKILSGVLKHPAHASIETHVKADKWTVSNDSLVYLRELLAS